MEILNAVSPYQMQEGGVFEVICNENFLPDEVAVIKKFDSKEYGIVELLIIKALYKYGVLNKYNLEKVINCKLKPELQKPKYDNNIRNLVQQGAIQMLMYNIGSETQLVVYALMSGTYSYMRKKYSKFPHTSAAPVMQERIDEAEKVAAIMERLSLNQWHIGITSGYINDIYQELYYMKKRFGLKRIPVQSYIELKIGDGTGVKKNVGLIGIPYAKDTATTEKMMQTIALMQIMNDAVTSRTHCLPVIICESLAAMEKAGNELRKIDKNVNPLFSIDRNNTNRDSLKWLYEYKQAGENSIYEIFRFI